MSLTQLTRHLTPALRHYRLWPADAALAGEPVVPCRSDRYVLLGTAFDYLLRFRAQALNPAGVVGRKWVAEEAAETLAEAAYVADAAGARAATADARAVLRELAGLRLDRLRPHVPRLAYLAAVLAGLDVVVREGRPPAPKWGVVAPDDVAELTALWDLVPPEVDATAAADGSRLNPTFGAAGDSVGGADADLLSGGLLVDIKTVKKAVPQGQYQDQLLGYYLLAERCRAADPSFPEITHVGIYFARHGVLTIRSTAPWADLPDGLTEHFWQAARTLCGVPVGRR